MKGVRPIRPFSRPLEELTSAFNEGGIKGEMWGVSEKYYRSPITDLMGEYGYEDLYLISSKGDIVYSDKKSVIWGKRHIRRLEEFRPDLAFKATEKQDLAFGDFAPYGPAGQKTGLLCSRPVFNGCRLDGYGGHSRAAEQNRQYHPGAHRNGRNG